MILENQYVRYFFNKTRCKLILVLIFIFLGLFCISSKAQNETKDISGSEKEYVFIEKNQDRYIGDFDRFIQFFFDTLYSSIPEQLIKLSGVACDFNPYMLVVSENRLQLINKDFDKFYMLNTGMKIHTASWSPFIESELFLLARDEFVKPNNKYTKYFPDTLFDLKLYRLDLTTNVMEYITTFYDISLTFWTFDLDAPSFFCKQSYIKIDKLKKLLYYDCYYPWAPDYIAPNLATYTYNFSNEGTFLSKRLYFEPNFLTGKIIRNYHFKFPFSECQKSVNGYYLLDKLEDSKPNVKIPISILHKAPILSYGKWKPELFRICFVKNGLAVCSFSMEVEMDKQLGNIYLIDYEGNLVRKLVENAVIGHNFEVSELSNGKYIIGDTYTYHGVPELRLYDEVFNLKMHFKELQHFEIKSFSVN